MLKAALAQVLSAEEVPLVYSAFDTIGDIVIIKIPDRLLEKKEIIGKAVLENVRPARSVFMQSSAVRGDYRLRELEFIAGANNTVTEYKEHGCRFKVDVAKTYFSPRLSTERERISRMVTGNEVIVNMFAGVGTYSIVIAKKNPNSFVYSIDSNEIASGLCEQNVRLNKVQDRVTAIHGDASRVISESLRGVADRVLMPLPEHAASFVDDAVLALKENSGGIVHFFAHVKADNKGAAKVQGTDQTTRAFQKYDTRIEDLRIVREVGPRIYQIVSDVRVHKSR